MPPQTLKEAPNLAPNRHFMFKVCIHGQINKILNPVVIIFVAQDQCSNLSKKLGLCFCC